MSNNHQPSFATDHQWSYARHRTVEGEYLVIRDDRPGAYTLCNETNGRLLKAGLSREEAVDIIKQWLAERAPCDLAPGAMTRTDVFGGATKLGLVPNGVLAVTPKTVPYIEPPLKRSMPRSHRTAILE
jgi:hypothetical protein